MYSIQKKRPKPTPDQNKSYIIHWADVDSRDESAV